ncbi:MAG: 50S ribosomal protein L6 [Candidatus Doudnabacteria bacterium]
MSRIGKKPVVLPSGVTAKYEQADRVLSVSGPKGELSVTIHPLVNVELAENEVVASVAKPDHKKQKALWGLTRALINNLVVGVTEGYKKELDVVGVGFKADLQGQKLVLNLGFSHPIEHMIPDSISAQVEKQPTKATIEQYQTTITLTGIDKQMLGQVAANIREYRKPEPYKGKGIRYSNEQILRKAGKVVKAVGG